MNALSFFAEGIKYNFKIWFI